MRKISNSKSVILLFCVAISFILPCFLSYIKLNQSVMLNAILVPYFFIGLCVAIFCINLRFIQNCAFSRLGTLICVIIYGILFVWDYIVFSTSSQNAYDGLVAPNPFYNYVFTSARFSNAKDISVGYISEFIFGFIFLLLIYSLVKAILEKRVKDFCKIKLADLIWIAMPILTIILDSLLIKAKIILSNIYTSYLPKYGLMTQDSIPFWLKLINHNTITSVFYLIAVAVLLSLILTPIRINKSVAILSIVLCIFSVMRQYLFLIGDSQLIYTLSKGTEISGMMSSVFLCVSVKTLMTKHKLLNV